MYTAKRLGEAKNVLGRIERRITQLESDLEYEKEQAIYYSELVQALEDELSWEEVK